MDFFVLPAVSLLLRSSSNPLGRSKPRGTSAHGAVGGSWAWAVVGAGAVPHWKAWDCAVDY